MISKSDNESFHPDDLLIRQIVYAHTVPDDNTGHRRVSSKAFSNSRREPGGMSVDIQSLIQKDHEDPKEFIKLNRNGWGSVSFRVEKLYFKEFTIKYCKTDTNDYHGEVWGSKDNYKITRGQRKILHKICDWYIPIPNVKLRMD